MSNKIRVETPTKVDRCRSLQTGRDPSADRGKSFHDRTTEFDGGTQIGGENVLLGRLGRPTGIPVLDLFDGLFEFKDI